jgi:class 3 adenylate cyclase
LLLESIFQAFDELARKAGVFKVETVGDCYVAVCGVPEANPKHAEVMARFARDCLDQFNNVVRGLELKLGPDTGDLALRYVREGGEGVPPIFVCG